MTKDMISVIVPTFNRAHYLVEALNTLTTQATEGLFQYEVVVVNNNSTDHSVEVVEEYAKTSSIPVRSFTETDRGDAPTRNRGIKESSGEWLVFFDDDQFAEPNWLLELFKAARRNDAWIVGGPVHLDLTDEEREELGEICCQALRETRFYDTEHQYDHGHLPGTGNALVHRRVFDEIGLFDTSLPMGGSDFAFFSKAAKSDFQMVYNPHAIIRHRIEEHRLTPEYLRWEAFSSGANHCAEFDLRQKGKSYMALVCLARLGKSALIHLPQYGYAKLTRNRYLKLGRRTKLWRTHGYLMKTLSVFAPKLFSTNAYMGVNDMQDKRKLGTKEPPQPVS